MIVIKRDGRKVPFNKQKIIAAISKAGYVKEEIKTKIATEIENLGKKEISIEEIQNLVEKKLMASQYKEVAKEYVRYRYKRELIRGQEKLSNEILEILDCKNDYVNTENSNKNPTLLSTQRDYMAGAISKDLAHRLLLPPDITEAHKEGIIHFHDADYYAQYMHNCCLVDLEDMLQHGTVISKTMIEKPQSFSTACNIATQVMAQVASNQYGGQSESIGHLAPFVDVSRQKIKKRVIEELKSFKELVTEEEFNKKVSEVTESRVKEEIKKGIQTMQYQINTLMTTNGQTPFVTIWLYLNEVPEGQTRDDLAMVIEEILKQRYQGVKNEKGVWITPAFPKLVYVTQDNNVYPGTKYWYLTKLAAKCSAKRLVPDYVSEKKMLELKVDSKSNGNVYPPMGCLRKETLIELASGVLRIGTLVDAISVIWYNHLTVRMIDKFQDCSKSELYMSHGIKLVPNKGKTELYIRDYKSEWVKLIDDVVYLLDTIEVVETPKSVIFRLPQGLMYIRSNGYLVGLKALLYNEDISDWLKITYTHDGNKFSSHSFVCTTDHPLPDSNKLVKRADEYQSGEHLIIADKDKTALTRQLKTATITSIDKVNYTGRSYDVTTESGYFDINQEILSHNCRSFLTPHVEEAEIGPEEEFEIE